MVKKADKLLNTREAMEYLKIDWNAIYTYISEGKLKAHKLGGNGKSRRHWRIWESDLIKFINGEGEKEHTEPLNKEVKSAVATSSPSSSLLKVKG